MSQGLANGNDSNLIITLCIRERDDDVHEDSKSNIARFAIVVARVFDSDQRTVKDGHGIVKVDAVLGEIELSLLFIPREYDRTVATLCRYVKTGAGRLSCSLTIKLTGDPRAVAKRCPRAVRVERWVGRQPSPRA
jgi:hypothetical protein